MDTNINEGRFTVLLSINPCSLRAAELKRQDAKSNVSGNVISYIYEAVKDKVSTLRLHHRHFKSRLPARKSL